MAFKWGVTTNNERNIYGLAISTDGQLLLAHTNVRYPSSLFILRTSNGSLIASFNYDYSQYNYDNKAKTMKLVYETKSQSY